MKQGRCCWLKRFLSQTSALHTIPKHSLFEVLPQKFLFVRCVLIPAAFLGFRAQGLGLKAFRVWDNTFQQDIPVPATDRYCHATGSPNTKTCTVA